MSINILSCASGAVLTHSGWAFGPVLRDAEDALAFVAWVTRVHGDPCFMDDAELERAHTEWRGLSKENAA